MSESGGKADLWRRRRRACEQGGLSRTEFCRRPGISLSTLQLWKRRLRSNAEASLQRCTFGSKIDRLLRDERLFPFVNKIDPREAAATVPPEKPAGKIEKRPGMYRLIPEDQPRIVHRHGLPPEEGFCDVSGRGTHPSLPRGAGPPPTS